MIPGTITLAGAIAAYAGPKMELSAICNAWASTISGGALFAIDQRQKYRQKRFDESDYADCNPLQNTMAKVYCDLSCVEDAVKRGDAQILSSIGTLNHNIVSEMKAFFDHYVSEIFTRLEHIEDKSSHENSQLKQVLDTYAKAEIDAVNSNGKQIIQSMNSQHSVMNQNLGNAAKQIFDLTHEEHKVLAEKIDGVNKDLAATSDAMKDLQQSTVQGFSDAFNEFADSLTDNSLLDMDLNQSTHMALASFANWHQESMHKVGSAHLQQIEQALRSLYQRMSAKKQDLESNQTLAQKREALISLQKDAKSTLHQLLQFQDASDINPAMVDQEMKKLLKAAQNSIQSHHMSAERMGRHMEIMQSEYNRRESVSQHIESQLVEFDKIMVQIRQAAEEYLEDASRQVSLVSRATELTDQYLSRCSSDFWELSLAARKALAAGKKAARSSRMAMNRVTRQVGLLADMLVDGGLARHASKAAAANLAAEAEQNAVRRGPRVQRAHAGVSPSGQPSEPNVFRFFGGQLLHAVQRPLHWLGFHWSDGREVSSDEEEIPDEVVQPGQDAGLQNAVQLFQALSIQDSASSTASALLDLPQLQQAVATDVLSQLQSRMPPFLPKAMAAFRLLQDLRQRHDMHGLGRAGEKDVQLMLASWTRLDSELAALAGEMQVEDSPLGAVFADRADALLEVLASVPAACRKHLPSGRWAAWGKLPGTSSQVSGSFGPWVLVKGAARLLQHKAGFHRSYHDFAHEGTTEALVCELSQGSTESTVRSLKEGELVVCFQNTTASQKPGCAKTLKLQGLVAQFWPVLGRTA